ncbi:hypothetical protein POTOM_056077 [Populus tomentosa]|uniref:Uncharacterized protein n=1 Tax=Populus tomentosa TaxID=118781 RepID=A0A8X7Y0C1_POPTO|nr:hypothetical protein POTOM_056077 [Populus tomentosa]
MKLVITGSDHFQFLFVDFVRNSPVLFAYSSQTDTWQSTEAREAVGLGRDAHNNYAPIVLRPRFNRRPSDGQNLLQVYGDGSMLVIKSSGGDDDGDTGVRMLNDIELWGGLRLNGSWHNWEYISKVPCKIKEQIRKPYQAMRGCLERRDGIIRAVLLSNYDGLWDIIWLSYDMGRSLWAWLPLPDCKMKAKGFWVWGQGLEPNGFGCGPYLIRNLNGLGWGRCPHLKGFRFGVLSCLNLKGLGGSFRVWMQRGLGGFGVRTQGVGFGVRVTIQMALGLPSQFGPFPLPECQGVLGSAPRTEMPKCQVALGLATPKGRAA